MQNIDDERLICEIKKRPAVWDMRTTEYSDHARKKECWDEICVLFGNEEMTDGEWQELEVLLQKKWKTITDNFAKDFEGRNRKSGSEEGQAPYMFSQQLQFLRDTIESEETSISLHGSLELQTNAENIGSSSDSSSDETPPRSKIPKRRLYPVEESIIRTLDRLNQNAMLEKDDNSLFLMSLQPSLSSLPKILNSKCRIEIMQTVIKYEEYALGQMMQQAPYSPQIHQSPCHCVGTRSTGRMLIAYQVPPRMQHHMGRQRSQAQNPLCNQFEPYPHEDAVSSSKSSDY